VSESSRRSLRDVSEKFGTKSKGCAPKGALGLRTRDAGGKVFCMPYKPRIQAVGCLYHVNANALDGLDLFRDEVDRMRFLDQLVEQVAKSDWTIFSYTLMTTHYHVLLQLREETLSSGFQRLHSLYARTSNRRHRRRGVLWQARYHDELIESDEHLYETIRYIAWNAPRVDACRRPEDWPWCSYAASLGLFPPDPLVDDASLLKLFADDRVTARRRLRAFVEEADPRLRRRLLANVGSRAAVRRPIQSRGAAALTAVARSAAR
jgi:REP element-mobilizing transposase RayT